jgi:hypothetical protein
LLGEQVKSGESFRCELELSVAGRMKADRGGKVEAIALSATATHKFWERAEHPDSAGGIGKAVRYYEVATSNSSVGREVSKRELAADRRLTVAQRNAEGTFHFSPNGALTRDELELVGEHFDTMCLPTLLPNKEVKIGEVWSLSNDAAQHACLFEGIVKNELQGKLIDAKDGVATFSISGTAEGIEVGAAARVKVTAVGKFDVTAKRIVELNWEQEDDRDMGAATPATTVKAVIAIKRKALAEEPKELSAEARAKVPEDKIPAAMTQLRYLDSEGKYGFTYSRDWHVIGKTSEHLMLRLLEKNQFAAQVTISAWKKAEAGKHTPPAEFKELVSKLTTWEAEGIIEDAEVPMSDGRWLYKLAMKGKQDGVPVVQTFYLLAGPNGDQLAFTVLVTADKAAKLGPKDLDLLKAIEFKKQ